MKQTLKGVHPGPSHLVYTVANHYGGFLDLTVGFWIRPKILQLHIRKSGLNSIFIYSIHATEPSPILMYLY